MTTPKKTYKKKAFIIAICIHALLILLLVLYKIVTPIPPFAEGGGGTGLGLEVNLGSITEGMPNEAENNEIVENTSSKNVNEESEKLLTDETDNESEAIKNNNEQLKKETPQPVKVPIKPKTTSTELIKPNTTPSETKPVVNTKALFPSKTKNTASNGTGTQAGVSGSPDGTEGSNIYTGNGVGSGGGTGGGSGTGSGTGVGNGVSFNLDGRNASTLPKPEYNGTEEGKVVVEVTVDKTGNVVNAIPGVKGSTTLDDYLLAVAKKAALQSKFNRKPDAPAFQKGSITYRFVLQ